MHVLAASPTETPPRKGRDLPTDHPTHTARPHSGHKRAPSPRPLLAPPCGRTESGGSGSAELCVAPASGALLRGTRRSREGGQSGRSQRCGVGLTLVASLLGELGGPARFGLLCPGARLSTPGAAASSTPSPRQGFRDAGAMGPAGARPVLPTDRPSRPSAGPGPGTHPEGSAGERGPRAPGRPTGLWGHRLRGATSGIAERTGSDGRLPLDMGFP